MRTHPKTKMWPVVSAAYCVLWASRAHAQPEDKSHPLAIIPPITVAPVAGVAPMGVTAPVAGVAPVGVTARVAGVAPVGAKVGEKDVAAVGLSASAVKMPLLVAKLRAHQVTPQEAWEGGDLNVPDLIYFLESLDRWGGFFWDKDPDLRRQMVALLVEHGQKQLEHPEGLSPVVRLWLADYYENLGDAKCLALCESILTELKPKAPIKDGGDRFLAFQSCERLAGSTRASINTRRVLKRGSVCRRCSLTSTS